MGALFLFMSLTNKPQWVAAYTSPRAEKMVTDRIDADLHLETYLPLHRVLRKWSDRMKSVEVPLIPSYTFIKMCERDIWRVRDVKGICGFVSFPSTGIAIIRQSEIDSLRRLADSMESVYVHNTNQLHKGTPVQIVAGYLKGMKGTIVKDCKDGNFSIDIRKLNISLVVSVEQDVLQAISPEQLDD